ncbi:MAG: hypothetical protein S0880_29040 [Actinomycetota bacterium]|nr:hypothetical protein [Actinomycetota bacterium]
MTDDDAPVDEPDPEGAETDAAEAGTSRTDGDGAPVSASTAGAPSSTSAADDDEERSSVVPAWLEVLAIVSATGPLAVGSVALVLAMLEAYSMVASLVIALPLWALSVWTTVRLLGLTSATSRRDHTMAGVVVLIVLASFAWNGIHASEHLWVGRDPGSYAATARVIVRDGKLTTDFFDPFLIGNDTVRPLATAAYTERVVEDGTSTPDHIEYQFNHVISAVLAVGYDIGGPTVMFRIPALLLAVTLLSIYAIAARLTRRSWLGVAAVIAFAASMPYVVNARDTYSESITALFFWAGLLATVHAIRRIDPAVAFAAGALIGGTAMARIDGAVQLVAAAPFALALACRGRRGLVAAGTFSLGAFATFAIGSIDGWGFSSAYYDALRESRRQVEALMAVAWVGCGIAYVLWRTRPAIRSWYSSTTTRLAAVAGVVVTGAMFALWFVRPAVQTVRDPRFTQIVEGLQRLEGRTPDPTRVYSEQTLNWMAWYLGPPAVALAAIGAGFLAWRSMRGETRWLGPVLGIALVIGGSVYLWRPEITPDHIWAMRRFVFVVVPGLAVLAVYGIAQIAQVLRSRIGDVATGALAALAALAVVVAPILATAPVRELQEQANFLGPMDDLCAALPEDAAVLVLQGARSPLTQTIYAWCGTPTASLTEPDPDLIREIAADSAAECRHLHIVSVKRVPTEAHLEVLEDLQPLFSETPTLTREVVNDRVLGLTLTVRPSAYDIEYLQIASAPVDIELDPSCDA